MWNDAVVTNAGKELLAQWLGGGELVIDSAATGQGTVAASLLMGQTELVSQKQNMSIVKAENIGGGRRLQLQLISEGVTNAYTINQIGIWARLGNGAAKMIAIFQDSTGISVPTFEQMPDYVFTFYATIQMSNSGELVVNVDKSAIVTRADFEEHTNNKENPHEVTQKQLFDDLTETTALAAADFIPVEVVADGTAKKISKENLHKALGLNTTSITSATVTLGASQTYSGSVKTQAVSSVVVGGKTLTAGTDYIVSGNTGTDAGNYTLVITGIGAYVGSIAKSWTIAKAAGSVSVSSSSVSVIGAAGKTTTVSVSRSGNGTIIAASSAPEVADVTLSGSTLTIKGMSSGSAVITVTVAAGTNHQAATCRISVSATIFPSVLNDNSWEQIRYASDNGIAASIWSVGATKKVKVQGNVGAQAIDAELWVYILGFNHNAAREGNNKIHFGTFKTAQSGGTDVGLIDNEYGKYYTDGRKCFNLNHWNPYNYGGWKACDARYDILGSTDTPPQNYGASRQTGDVGYDASATCATNPVANTLMAALPADLRAVMKPITKYTDNIGGGTGNVASNVTTSVDYLPLLAEYEIFGSRTYANSTEQNYQAQYAYFANGNPKLKYRHLDVSQTAFWWVRSPYYRIYGNWCIVNTSGAPTNSGTYYSRALAPAFAV